MGSGKLQISDFEENLHLARFSTAYRIDSFSCGIVRMTGRAVIP